MRSAVVLVLLLCPSLVGCGNNQRNGDSSLSQRDRDIAGLLSSRTDALLRDVVTGRGDVLRGYFAPETDVDAPRQIQRYLGVSEPPFRVTHWDAQIDVRLAPDRRRAQTHVVVEVQQGGRQSETKVVVFNWISTDEKCQVFHLVPLK